MKEGRKPEYPEKTPGDELQQRVSASFLPIRHQRKVTGLSLVPALNFRDIVFILTTECLLFYSLIRFPPLFDR